MPILLNKEELGEKRSYFFQIYERRMLFVTITNILIYCISHDSHVYDLFSSRCSPIDARMPPSISGFRGTGTTLNTTISSTPVLWYQKVSVRILTKQILLMKKQLE